MVVIEDTLIDRLQTGLYSWNKIVILGIGNELNSDDGLGIRAAKKLKKTLSGIAGIEVLAAGTSPENLTGLLRRLSPSHVLLIDAVDTGETAGTLRLVDYRDIKESMPSTHTLPISVFVKYLEQELDTKVVILGIQPENLDFGTKLSVEVEKSVEMVVDMIEQIVAPSHESRRNMKKPAGIQMR
jgi:hydrogenase 3 maturation protease